MVLVEKTIDEGLLNQILEWVQKIDGIVDFQSNQAISAVFLAQKWRLDALPVDDEATLLIALTISFWNWFDDRSDQHLHQAETLINWERLIGITEGTIIADSPETPEEAFLLNLSAALRQRAKTEAEYDWWFRTFAPTFRAMQFEEQVARKKVAIPSFAESLEYGILSITALNVLAASYLIYGMGRHLQENNLLLSALERYFCAYQRIINDVKSVEKERRETNTGCFSNLVLLAEGILSPQLAQEFVLHQADGYERLIMTNIELLGQNSLFAQLIKTFFEVVLQIYKLPGFSRYNDGC